MSPDPLRAGGVWGTKLLPGRNPLPNGANTIGRYETLSPHTAR